MRIKSLPSSLRERRRYIAFAVESDFELSAREVHSALFKSTVSLIGEVGVSELSLRVIEAKPTSLIVGCNHLAVSKVIACAALVGEINGKAVHLCSLGVSGTLRALRKKFLSRSNELIEVKAAQVNFRGKTFTVARKDYNRLDLLPRGEFLERTEKYKVRYIGIMQSDLRGD